MLEQSCILKAHDPVLTFVKVGTENLVCFEAFFVGEEFIELVDPLDDFFHAHAYGRGRAHANTHTTVWVRRAYRKARSVMVAYISVHHQLVATEQGCCGLLLSLAAEDQADFSPVTVYENDKHLLLLSLDVEKAKNPPAADFWIEYDISISGLFFVCVVDKEKPACAGFVSEATICFQPCEVLKALFGLNPIFRLLQYG